MKRTSAVAVGVTVGFTLACSDPDNAPDGTPAYFVPMVSTIDDTCGLEPLVRDGFWIDRSEPDDATYVFSPQLPDPEAVWYCERDGEQVHCAAHERLVEEDGRRVLGFMELVERERGVLTGTIELVDLCDHCEAELERWSACTSTFGVEVAAVPRAGKWEASASCDQAGMSGITSDPRITVYVMNPLPGDVRITDNNFQEWVADIPAHGLGSYTVATGTMLVATRAEDGTCLDVWTATHDQEVFTAGPELP